MELSVFVMYLILFIKLSCVVLLCFSQKDGTQVSYNGMLSSECVKSYHRMYVTGQVPPRTYQYYHEYLASGEGFGDVIDVEFRIVGGKQVPISAVPYNVMYGLYCGGTLIAPDWVITAAHCKEKEKFVYAGSTRRSSAPKYRICAHFVHPMWNEVNKTHSHDYDYQLLLLEKPVPVTPNSMPIAIGSASEIIPEEIMSVSGWGHIQAKGQMQDHVRRVYIPIIAQDVCSNLPNINYNTITPRMFCIGLLGGTKDSCQGDSGGPAVSQGKLLGLVSFGLGCAAPDQPGVYSNIPVARDWIRNITGLPL